MSTSADKLISQIKDLPATEKLRLVDAILTELDKPDPEIDRIWAEEARQRWAAYKTGSIPTVSYEEVRAKYTSKR
jgi:putative addiction module component (TIGR02574 family)